MNTSDCAIIVALAALVSCGAYAAASDVVINEIAWGGTTIDHTHEWIELLNTSDRAIDLTGWRLVSSDGAPHILLHGMLPPRSGDAPSIGYLLLERGDDESVPAVAADVIYTGALNDRGEVLFLYDPEGSIVDSANAPARPDEPVRSWAAGIGGPGYPEPRSMERVNPVSADQPGNWATSRRAPDPNDLGSSGGTPKRQNSAYNLPPTAVMIITPTSPKPGHPVLFDASPSTDQNDEIVRFSWLFGDGATAAGQTASHTYAEAGDYEVGLTVYDRAGGIGSEVRVLSISIPVLPLVDFSIIPREPAVPLRAGTPLRFQDETAPGNAELVQRFWDFGDGATAEGASTDHTFASAGSYSVRLAVVDARGIEAVQTASVTIASRRPTAQFVVLTERPNNAEPIVLDAGDAGVPDGEITKFEWDFDGDGTVDRTTIEPIVEHLYESSGSKKPTLVVEDAEGDRSDPFSRTICVNAVPVAQFSVSTFTPSELESVAFTDDSSDPDGVIVSRLWTFDDGETSTQSATSHAFASSGVHTVTLTVVDDQSGSATATATLQVENLPPIACVTSSSESAETGDPFRFDASGSTDPSPRGSIVSYAWDLDGDGAIDRQTDAPSVSQAYSDDGNYTVTVCVTDDLGVTVRSAPVRVTVFNRRPAVRWIRWTPERPTDGDEVIFSAGIDDSDGEVVDWEWTFGEEGRSADPEPRHVFGYDKTYTVRLAVRDDDGATSEPLAIEIEIANATPIAAFSFWLVEPGVVQFTAQETSDPSPNGRIVHLAWDFGDGTACPEVPSSCGGEERSTPIHRYPIPGTYAVTLIAIDDDGGIARLSRTLTIH